MLNNPVPILVIILLLKNRNLSHTSMLNTLHSLQVESLIDNLHNAIHAMEKLGSLSQADLASSLPDMKKMLEVVEKLPL